MTEGDVRQSLDDLSGDIYASAMGAMTVQANLVVDALRDRFTCSFGGPAYDSIPPLAYDEPARTSTESFDRCWRRTACAMPAG